MFFRCAFLFALCLFYSLLPAQERDTAALPEVVIKAFEQGRRLRDVAAPVAVIGTGALQRFSPASIVHAVNTAPGVRMEERSPGSFRFNIRGSSLRSPFGVRNVKVYFNDLPITDPGGITYLNQLGYYNFHSLEIIKGPGSSLYGAGTGGVLLIEGTSPVAESGATVEYTTGSYGLHNLYAGATAASEKLVSSVGFQHQQSEGYRQHSRLRRQVLTWTNQFRFSPRSALRTTFLYGDLFYQTPGALTAAEFSVNPRAARPGNASFPGAVAAQASVSQKQVLAGASLTQQLSATLSHKTVAYGMFTELRNPTIQNYGRTGEPHGGGRTSFDFKKNFAASQLQVLAGAEVQAGWPSVSIHKNLGGQPDSLRTQDALRNVQTLVFAQAVWENRGWQLTAGTGWSLLQVRAERFTPAATGRRQRAFNNGAAPRIAVLRKLKTVNLYAAVARGFSPPTTAELLPTGGAANLELNAEKGWNYEAGIKGHPLPRLYMDVNAFRFGLQNTIVQRRTAGGGDFFINAGSTEQWGLESFLSYPLLHRWAAVRSSLVWISHTFHAFRYGSFAQLANDFSGKRMPATPQHTLSTGVELEGKEGWLATITYYGAGSIPLNDANTAFARPYHLLGARAGYQRWVQHLQLKVVAGVENLLDETYSLGNDVNGFGGRYFNAAPRRNYFASLLLAWRK